MKISARRIAERWHTQPPCTMRTISNKKIDLLNVTEDVIDIRDIAHALHRLNRFNGHTNRPYNVLSHSMCAATLMPEGKKMEGLLHDAAESYIGDVITPVKELFPEIVVYEDKLQAIILGKYDINKESPIVIGSYKKSTMMMLVDKRLGRGEHAVLRPACKADLDHEVLNLMQRFWDSTPQDFLYMYLELGGKM